MSRQWCDRHWAVVRDDPSINGIFASIALMQRFVNSDEVASLAGQEGHRDAKTLNKLLESTGPLCCWVGDEGMVAIYNEARIAPEGAPDVAG